MEKLLDNSILVASKTAHLGMGFSMNRRNEDFYTSRVLALLSKALQPTPLKNSTIPYITGFIPLMG